MFLFGLLTVLHTLLWTGPGLAVLGTTVAVVGSTAYVVGHEHGKKVVKKVVKKVKK